MKPHPFLFVSTFLFVSLSAPVSLAGSIKCWTNKQGVRECGNAVPPEYSQQGHEEIQGFKVKRTEGALSPEELEAKLRAEREKAERDALHRQKVRERLTQDRVLLNTFTTADELKLALDGKVAVIDSRIRLTSNRVTKLKANLLQLEEQAARQERSGKEVSDTLQEDIAKVQRQIRENEGFIAAREQEKSVLLTEFEQNVKRFKALKSGQVQPGQLEEEPPETPAD